MLMAPPLGLLGMPAAYLKGTAASVSTSDSLRCEQYSCHEGFENAFPEVKLWASNGLEGDHEVSIAFVHSFQLKTPGPVRGCESVPPYTT